MSIKKRSFPKHKLDSILLVDSSFSSRTPFEEDMKKNGRVLIEKDCTVHFSKDKSFGFAFPEIKVSLSYKKRAGSKTAPKVLSISIEYFLAFRLAKAERLTASSLKEMALKTAWPFLTRDVIDYTTKAGYSPIYLDLEDTEE
jgi:hypothetical protein